MYSDRICTHRRLPLGFIFLPKKKSSSPDKESLEGAEGSRSSQHGRANRSQRAGRWLECHSRYSTVGCRRTGGRRSQPGSFLFFTTSANLVLILQSVFESRRLACSAQTVCDDACWAGNAAETFQTVEVESFRSPSNAAEEVVFTANSLCVW